ncbi:MAG: BlaI/MecI/CopY family transcriptional regulator [Bacteroidota bacterium]
MKRLSPREEKVMRIMWRIGEGVVRDVIEQMPPPPPPYNTVSSIIRILEEKGYLSHKAYGRTHVYFPIVKEEDFRQNSLQRLVSHYFSGSPSNLVSFMVEHEALSEAEIQRIRELLDRVEANQQSETGEEEYP